MIFFEGGAENPELGLRPKPTFFMEVGGEATNLHEKEFFGGGFASPNPPPGGTS